jgi:outer membrane biosynthesis protein TonB
MKRTATVEAAMSLLLCGALLTGHLPRSKASQGSSTQQQTKAQSFYGKIVSQNGVRFVLRDDDNNVWYHLDDQEKAAKLVGRDVLVTGKFDGLTGTIRVQSIVESPPPPKPAPIIEEPKQNSQPAKDAAGPPPAADATASGAPQSPSAQQPPSKVPAPRSDDPPISAETKLSHPPQGQLPNSRAPEAPPPSSLTLPEEAVSSSSSIAISSRRSVPIPSGVNPETQSSKKVQAGRLLKRVAPSYPPEAIQQQIEGTVQLHAVIGDDGQVLSLEPVSGPPLLVAASEIAVRQWRYAPTLFDGLRVQVYDDVRLVFRLPN